MGGGSKRQQKHAQWVCRTAAKFDFKPEIDPTDCHKPLVSKPAPLPDLHVLASKIIARLTDNKSLTVSPHANVLDYINKLDEYKAIQHVAQARDGHRLDAEINSGECPW